jgi:hypothetical protein
LGIEFTLELGELNRAEGREVQMVMTVREEEREKEILEAMRRSEESALETGRKWAKAVGEAVPMEMPVVREFVKGAFDFTDEVLKSQRKFARTMLRATRPARVPTRGSPRATVAHDQAKTAGART